MNVKIHIIDAFTDVRFKGNSAAVIIIDSWLSDELMQSIASENNLSETAFVKRFTSEEYQIRWFSPITEIDFCGHATLAASFVIFNENQYVDEIKFTAKAVGELTVTKGEDDYIQMCFPNRAPRQVHDIPPALLEGLSIAPIEVLINDQAYIAVYQDEADVLAIEKNDERLKLLAPFDIAVTARSRTRSQKYDFVSRYFWPANGGGEDPVTGSIHAGLAPYWSQILSKNTLTAYQASKRGGLLLCRIEGDKVFVSGKAVQYLEGVITL
ncbi:PhzF family phenazine biosynthesis protein [Shewanella sp. VB17]|uniref:PhzF family phenazine biosynthesis protein n=1 Tax=Shewanella sp. VB17 TaxID=2739432 RepID=UPI001566A0C6|nr:PhzF family phenazine biosynthesis protein [Shewanella sp. VB17]NRD74454.1 PhzF family phenazine biosynthesis protein [Shewanella sp. VB17]